MGFIVPLACGRVGVWACGCVSARVRGAWCVGRRRLGVWARDAEMRGEWVCRCLRLRAARVVAGVAIAEHGPLCSGGERPAPIRF